MAIDKIKRNFVWLRKVLRITEKTTLPGEILGEVRPILDTFGWDFPSIENQTQVTPGVTQATNLPPVPEGEAHLFFACNIFHNDGLGSKAIAIRLENSVGQEVALISTLTSVEDNELVALLRPIFVPAGFFLMGRSTTSIAGGSDFTISGFFVRLEPGQYLAASPWG